MQIDGRAVGTTPLTVREVPSGMHAVTMQVEAHRDFARSVTVRPNETQALEGRLTALEGTLSVLVRPWGNDLPVVPRRRW